MLLWYQCSESESHVVCIKHAMIFFYFLFFSQLLDAVTEYNLFQASRWNSLTADNVFLIRRRLLFDRNQSESIENLRKTETPNRK